MPYTLPTLWKDKELYEHFKPVEPVFVDREEYLEWMTAALSRCQDQSVLLHLRGIGGIGKTALIEHWRRTIDHTILLDCGQVTDFFDRLDILAKNAARLGVKLRRFDLLWSIRLRFVKGTEPAKAPGRSWAFDVIKPLPFIGNMVSISKAIRAVGMKLSPRMKKRFGDVAGWLRNRLGKKYVEKLLETLWKEPHQAEVLFLDALLEDLKGRKSQQPVLVLLDHFEHVDTEQLRWHYKDRKICEAELWWVFLSSLTNTVSITVSRRQLPEGISLEVPVEEMELTELDPASCRDLLAQRGVEDEELQTHIVSTTGGNPFALHAICDLRDLSSLSLDEVKSFRADTLEQVRLKIWRRLFSQAEGLHESIDQAGLLPFFTRKILTLLVPHLKTDHWDRLMRLSFVRDLDDGTWNLHDLARDLVLAELGDRLPKLALETATLLEGGAKEQSDVTLLGLALSVQALVDEKAAIDKATTIAVQLLDGVGGPSDVLSLVANVRFSTDAGQANLHSLRGFSFLNLWRWAEVEPEFHEAIRLYRELVAQDPSEYQPYFAWTLLGIATVFFEQGRSSEIEEVYLEAFQLLEDMRQLGEVSRFGSPDIVLHFSINLHRNYAWSRIYDCRIADAEAPLQKAITYLRQYVTKEPTSVFTLAEALSVLGDICTFICKTSEAEKVFQEAAAIIRKHEKDGGLFWSFFAARVLSFYAISLMMRGRIQDAARMFEGTVEHQREYLRRRKVHTPQYSPIRVLIFLSRYLNFWGASLRHLDQLTRAEAAVNEALTILRGLSEQELRMRPMVLSYTLSNLAILLRQTGRLKEAETAYKEAVAIYRPLADQIPKAYLTGVVILFQNYAVLLRQTNRLAEAEEALREALAVSESFIANDPDFTPSLVAASLNNLGIVLAEAGKPVEAEEVFRESLKIRRVFAKKAPSMYLWTLVSTLNNLGVLCKRSNRLTEAEQYYREALEHGDALGDHESKIVQSIIARTLSNLALLLKATGAPAASLEEVLTRLEAVGVTQLPDTEEWTEEEIDNIYF